MVRESRGRHAAHLRGARSEVWGRFARVSSRLPESPRADERKMRADETNGHEPRLLIAAWPFGRPLPANAAGGAVPGILKAAAATVRVSAKIPGAIDWSGRAY